MTSNEKRKTVLNVKDFFVVTQPTKHDEEHLVNKGMWHNELDQSPDNNKNLKSHEEMKHSSNDLENKMININGL